MTMTFPAWRSRPSAAPALLAVLALGGCVIAPPVQRDVSLDTEAWWTHQQTVRDIDAFTLDARLSNRTVGSASLRWRQDGDRFNARVSGPFGSGAAALAGTPDAVTIRTGRDTVETPYPEAWMQTELGWHLPLGALRYWAIGLPMPGAPAEYAFDAHGRLAVLEQAGWRLDYTEYTQVDGVALPRRVHLDDGQQQALLRIDQWLRVARHTAHER